KKIKKITVQQFGTCRFVRSPTAADIALAKKGLDSVKEKIKSKKFDLIILDEINNALNLGLLEINQVLEAIKTGICGPEIILTGRNAPKKIIKIADLVSEIKEVKHYYARGIKARKGIEY
ncbi:MAG: cob(I)yrinic acid a,c-diamide adenosyltransferase, partial [Candidatus Omnitrophica bacterium]|nr:cob(I)yrinic acid a,c-diamide adenosyltransferase [Candidatus Omnitrophota bacterium]